MTDLALRFNASTEGGAAPAAGLPDRAVLAMSVERQLAACRRNGTTLSVLSLGLGGLDAVRQKHGDAIEQQVLDAAWTRLKSRLRGSDFAVHVGRDEFGAVLHDAVGPVAEQVRARVAAALAEPYGTGGLEITIAVRGGVAGYPESGSTGEVLARAAARDRGP
jgi:diguanylate cyclase (GGDEF)-like protein